MNKIISVVREKSGAELCDKNFNILTPCGGTEITLAGGRINLENGFALIIPPLVKYSVKKGNTLICTVEKALLPFKDARLVADDRNEICNAAVQAEYYLQSQLSKKELILSALGGLIVACATAFADEAEYSPVTLTVRAEILNHLSDVTFSLESLIKKLPLNYDYVRKLFQKEVGVTPHEFLTRERMNLARELIMSGISNQYSVYTVSQIAEACGFSEPLYFSRVFKKYYGAPPSEYGK